MGNSLDSCRNDINTLKNIFNSDIENIIHSFTDCYPEKEIKIFLKENKIQEDDIVLVYFSGHGKLIGKRVKNKMEMVSTWVNPDGSYVYSFIIDYILSQISCKRIVLISDSCHSSGFGKYYTGKSPYIFIGSSSIISTSNEYNIPKGSQEYIPNSKTQSLGILTYLFIDFHRDILYGNPDNIISLINTVYKKHKITKLPIVKLYSGDPFEILYPGD